MPITINLNPAYKAVKDSLVDARELLEKSYEEAKEVLDKTSQKKFIGKVLRRIESDGLREKRDLVVQTDRGTYQLVEPAKLKGSKRIVGVK